MRAHVAALLAAVRGETVTHIFVTHTHRDHSPATAALKRATGAQVLAEGPHRPARPLFVGEAPRSEAAADTDFMPDKRLADSDVVDGRGWTLEAVATPGHTANHMGYVLREPAVHFVAIMSWAGRRQSLRRRTAPWRITWLRSKNSGNAMKTFISPGTAISCGTRGAMSMRCTSIAGTANPRSSRH